jgi:SAM-dependent methyltransferase
MSETAAARPMLSQFCVGMGLDLGFGGSAITGRAICLDLPHPYCPSLEGHRQHLRGDATKLDFVCDEAMDYVYSSHLIEDYYTDELIEVIKEWRRVLVPGGVLVLNSVDQKRFLAHCARTGQGTNENHKEPNFSHDLFVKKVIPHTGKWQVLYELPFIEPYSWYWVGRKA